MRFGRRIRESAERPARRTPVPVSRNLTGESLVPRRGTWGARPGSAGAEGTGGSAGTNGTAGAHGGGGSEGAEDGLRADPGDERAAPERAPAQRVRWNLSA